MPLDGPRLCLPWLAGAAGYSLSAQEFGTRAAPLHHGSARGGADPLCPPPQHQQPPQDAPRAPACFAASQNPPQISPLRGSAHPLGAVSPWGGRLGALQVFGAGDLPPAPGPCVCWGRSQDGTRGAIGVTEPSAPPRLQTLQAPQTQSSNLCHPPLPSSPKPQQQQAQRVWGGPGLHGRPHPRLTPLRPGPAGSSAPGRPHSGQAGKWDELRRFPVFPFPAPSADNKTSPRVCPSPAPRAARDGTCPSEGL